MSSKVLFSWGHDYTSLLPDSQRHLLNRTTPYRRIIAGALLTAVLLLTYALSSGDAIKHSSNAATSTDQADIEDATRPLFLSLLIPGGKKNDVETCRTVLSAQVLNYPIPQIIPLDSSPPHPRDEGSNKASPESTSTSPAQVWVEENLKWLARTPPEGEDGIVIVLDQPGVYFQLRPQVLLERYYRVLREADENVKKDPKVGGKKKRIHHSIVFPAMKSNGYMMGPVQDIRRLLKCTLANLQQNPSASIPSIFTTLYNEQLLHRQTSTDQNWFTFNQEPELGITLDATHLLGTSILPSDPNGGEWKPLSPSPPEIADSTPPYWTVFGSEPTLSHTATWSDVPLFHPNTSSSLPPPAMLHHPPSTSSTHRSQTWTSLFYHPHARTLYTAAQHLPSTIVASIPIFSPADGGRTRLGERTFWNRRAKPDTAGAFNGGLKNGFQIGDAMEEDFWPWRDMCGGDTEVEGVFGDGKGPWVGGKFY